MSTFKLALIFVALLFSFKISTAQKSNQKQALGTIEQFVNSLAATTKTNSIQTISMGNGVEFNVKITIDRSSLERYDLVGTVQGYENGKFIVFGNNQHLDGNIVLMDTKEAYRIISENGNVFIEPVDIHNVICITPRKNKKVADDNPIIKGQKNKAQPIFNSNPSVTGVIYLDFDGEVVPPGAWSNSTINAQPQQNYSNAQIEDMWLLIAEDYISFNVNVTTDPARFNSAPANRRIKVIFTDTDIAAPGFGGSARNGSYYDGSNDPCWVFNEQNGSVKDAAETGSHEAGHTFGLSHDGDGGNTYSYGHGDWAPIMGSVFENRGSEIGHWSKGEYTGANNTEDDISILVNGVWWASYSVGLGYRTDDHSNNLGSATLILADGSGNVTIANNYGMIERATDVDIFEFTTSGGAIDITISGVTGYSDARNLDIQARLLDASGNQVILSNPNSIANANIQTTLSAGTYYIEIDGVGYLNPSTTGYSDYASLGRYYISGNYPLGANNQPPSIFQTSFDVGCNSVTFDAIVFNLVDDFLWDFGDGTTSTDPKPTHTYSNSGPYTVKLTVDNVNGSDDSTEVITIIGTPNAPAVTGGSRCGAGIVNLSASGTGDINWYDAISGGNLVNSGTTYAPNIAATTTYYVDLAEGATSTFGGIPNNTTATGGNFPITSRWNLFDVHESTVLKSVKVYAQGTADRTIELVSSTGTVLETTTVNIPDGEQKVVLNFSLTPGADYYLRLNGTANLYRSTTGVSYPYNIGNFLTITGTNGTASDYYFFYDLEVGTPGCVSNRASVIGEILCVGLEDLVDNKNVHIYPNPTSGQLNIEIPEATKNFEYFITDIVGQVVRNKQQLKAGMSNNINIKDLTNGIYFVQVLGEKESKVFRIIKE